MPQGFKSGFSKAAAKARSRAATKKGRTAQVAQARSRAVMNPRTGGFLGLEFKFVDYTNLGQAVTTTPAFVDDGTALALNSIATGDTESARDGRKVTCRSVHVRGYLGTGRQEAQVAPIDDVCVRVLLVLDTQCNGAQGTATNVIPNFYGWRNLQFTTRYKVLKDKVFRLPATAGSSSAAANDFNAPAVEVPFSFSKKLNFATKFSGTTAVVGSIVDNALHLIAVIDTGTNNTCTINYTSRVRFTDA